MSLRNVQHLTGAQNTNTSCPHSMSVASACPTMHTLLHLGWMVGWGSAHYASADLQFDHSSPHTCCTRVEECISTVSRMQVQAVKQAAEVNIVAVAHKPCTSDFSPHHEDAAVWHLLDCPCN